MTRVWSAALPVDFDDFHEFGRLLELAGHHLADAAAAQDGEPFDFEILFARPGHQLADVFPAGDDINHVAPLEERVPLGDKGLAAAGDGHDLEGEGVLFIGEVGGALVEHPRAFFDAEDHQLELSAREVDELRDVRLLEQVADLGGGYLFGIEQQVDAHIGEHHLVVVVEVFRVVDACGDLLGPQFLGDDG